MTLDELFEKYHEAWSAVARQTDGDRQSAGRAGVTAIVRALRDETRHMTLNRDSLEELFTQILGIAAEEKVAEGIAERADEQRADAPATDPIRDPAPAVCVWTMDNRIQRYRPQCNSEGVYHPAYARVVCPHCSRRVKFTEANHG